MGPRSSLVISESSTRMISWTIGILILLHSLSMTNPHKGANGLKRELFFLNLEDGFFGCQVNESVDVLKVFELSKLCDGTPQCFLGSDELHEDLKCSDDCSEKTGRKCVNGACLSSQCYCNDGFGGKGCEMPDENECKFRPCDIFAQCTNTLGGYFCSCHNGYEGDGFRCKDIDECKIPELSSTCVENAECWNLPGHYACRCLPGFEGDGKVACHDVNECEPSPCGPLATCEEKKGGGYSCHCPLGFVKNPLKADGCEDYDECSQTGNLCRGHSECHNVPGSYKCVCPQGFLESSNMSVDASVICEQVDVRTRCKSNFDCVNNAECSEGQCSCRAGFDPIGPSCLDIDECKNGPCGIHAECGNVPGGFRCECGVKFPLGDPFIQCKASCEDVSCGPHAYCSANELHAESGEAYCVCEEGWTYDPKNITAGCIDINECDLGTVGPCGPNSECHNHDGSFSCFCLKGFTANPSPQNGCHDVNECEAGSHNCAMDSHCLNLLGSFECTCPPGTVPDPDPRIKCTKVTKCLQDEECPGNGVCDPIHKTCTCPEPNVGEDCRHPCERVTCGPRADCVLVNNEKPTCVCPKGFHGSPATIEGCLDTDECLFQPCGEGICRNEPGKYRCECPLGYEPLRVHNSSGYPESCRSVTPRSCRRETDCPLGEECVDHTSNRRVCVCPRGFTRDFQVGECRDVNECLELDTPCGVNAICRNLPGSYDCTCPQKYPVGNPFLRCEECNSQRCPCPPPFKLSNSSCVMDNCSPQSPCSNGGSCLSVTGGLNYCECPKGYSNGKEGSCEDINECLKTGACGPGAECFNKPGSFKCVCPINHQGDPYKEGCLHPLLKCQSADDCGPNEKCLDPGICVCAPPYKKEGNGCHLHCDSSQEGNGKVCSAAQKRTCVEGGCGTNAECVDGGCTCKLGFEGDGYTKCQDVNECEEDVCGRNAKCINFQGGYDCRCELGHPVGNPFVECFKPPQNLVDCDRSVCPCIQGKDCPSGFLCKSNVCVDECAGVTCGPNSVCLSGKCDCLQGFSGPTPSLGCEYRNCESDLSCSSQEICYGTLPGQNRVCVDGCSKMECGSNSVCLTENHLSSCVCKDLFVGNGLECTPIKISERVDECGTSLECSDGFLCSRSPSGVRKCIDPCETTNCGGPNQICVREQGRAICKCKPGFTISKETGVCQLPAISDCSIDDECPIGSGCVQDGLGIGHCTSLCEGVTCGQNAVCMPDVTKVGVVRRASCHCNAHFTGNPEDRIGCQPMILNECEEDVDCSENHICVGASPGRKCQLACDRVKCGPNSVCVSNNHAAQCKCLPGKYVGDARDQIKGCFAVPCIYNSDCLGNQTCNRLQNQCHDVCSAESCGVNAICVPEKHSYRCVCALGFAGHDPESGCYPIKKDCAAHNPCHTSAVCELGQNNVTCTCREGEGGDPYGGEGCQIRRVWSGDSCSSHEQCPSNSICRDRKCSNPCQDACAGKNSICHVVGRIATCKCRVGFEASTRNNETICSRVTSKCITDQECADGICVDGQCKVICQDKGDCGSDEVCLFGMCMLPCIGHAQCGPAQACAGGFCVIGCRNNKECSLEESCLNHRCSNPCIQEGVCGANAVCRVISHSPQCYCPDGFISSSSDGCHRNNTHCSATQDCPVGAVCLGGVCFLSCDTTAKCARGEQCQNNICVKVCYTDSNCQLGEICVDGVCSLGCRSDGDCALAETCLSSKCRCGPGFTSGPTGCRDINECDDPGVACHSSANCLNTPGSFRCECPDGLFSENPKVSKCEPPSECSRDTDCPETLSCLLDTGSARIRKCLDPCTTQKCGARAECRVESHRAECHCPLNHLGDPYALDTGCHAVECTGNEHCPENKTCDALSNRCLDPCDGHDCGSHAVCSAKGHQTTCGCLQGFAATNGSCQDVNECQAEHPPCHFTANCVNSPGGFRCECPHGTVGDPNEVNGCKSPGECESTEDCPSTATCVNGKCKLVCEGACGAAGTTCEVKDHKPVCSCLPTLTGDPHINCSQVKCREENDCGIRETCYDKNCMSPCDIPHICGQHSNCSVISHKALCLCMAGHTGDPVLGCIKIMSCDSQSLCPPSSVCQNGICRQLCSAHRDCSPVQSCLNGICQSPCTFDSDCSPWQICESGFCKDHGTCRTNSNCPLDASCVTTNGISACIPVCDKLTSCPRNSHCIPKEHVGTCHCNDGFVKDTTGNCVQVECRHDADCPDTKTCLESQCHVTCKLPNSCPSNSICTPLDHRQKCECSPGFISTSVSGNGSELTCSPVDFCADSPCGFNGHCENAGGSYKCLCPNGEAPNTEGNCESEVKCKNDQECPNTSTGCSAQGICSYLSTCPPGTCGPHAKCLVKDYHEIGCKCLPGFVPVNEQDTSLGCFRNPPECLPGVDCIKKNSYCNGTECFGSCESNVECSPSEICDGQQCLNPCDAPGSCGVNSLCTTVDHVKSCYCQTDFTGVPDVECVRVAVPCHSTGDCPPNQECGNGICFPNCTSDLSCASNERCVEGSCMLTCRLDNDCFLNHICSGNMCVSGCRSNGDCSMDESCQDQKCINLCKVDACGPNAICQSVDHQPRCSCPSGMLPYPTPLLGCIREPVTCSENRECGEGLVCVRGFCKSACVFTTNCLSTEVCDGGFCTPSCRKDSDCPEADICNNFICEGGCRTDENCKSAEFCQENKCSDPCKPHCAPGNWTCSGLNLSPCGPNSRCTVENHLASCHCEPPFVEVSNKSCVVPEIGCGSSKLCPDGMTCLDEKCRISCSSDEKCQKEERCVSDICRAVCSQDSQCGEEEICKGRICVKGCRSDAHCPVNRTCVNRLCSDPCEGNTACGACATCETVDHRPVCSCPLDWAGNPQTRCHRPYAPCQAGTCPSGETCQFGSCLATCKGDSDCGCLQSCHLGHCRNPCGGSHGECPGGELCEDGYCQPSCQLNSDCSPTESCIVGICSDPCLSSPCFNSTSRCKVSQHRPICICNNGSPEINGECADGECGKDSDCRNQNNVCLGGHCKNPCLENEVCGHGASCRMINRKPLCTCPIGWTGSPTTECVLVGKDDCRGKGCGVNSSCSYTENGFRCTCAPGCVPRVSPEEGCKCLLEPASGSCNLKCGTHAICKVEDNKQKRCVCPSDFPEGDPMVSCSALDRIDDCRVRSCGKGAICSKVNGLYDCRCPGGTFGNPQIECLRVKPQCTKDSMCGHGEICIRGTCESLCVGKRCPANQQCQVTGHRAECLVNQTETAESRPSLVINPEKKCNSNGDCMLEAACNLVTGRCEDPCTFLSSGCSANRECKVEGHVPRCVCKGFQLSPKMELICPDVAVEPCGDHGDCDLSHACIFGTCQDPCAHRKCPADKTCETLHHAPYCLCAGAHCNATIEICLKDSGCPSNSSCVTFRCLDPCQWTKCPLGYGCLVLGHKPFCKVCKLGDQVGLCQVSANAEITCELSSECGSSLLCVKGTCRDPCITENPCAEYQICRVLNQTISCQTAPPETITICTNDKECPTNAHCNPATGSCSNPCAVKKCGPTSYCVVENHAAKCLCLEGGTEHEGNCIRRFRTDFPRPEMTVNCLADGIQVDILTGPFGTDFRNNGSEFNGLLYVKGHSKDPQCRKSVQPFLETVDFEVKFGSCGLLHNDGEASFVMVIQKHPRLVTYNAQAYDIKCVYMTGEKTITLGFNVSMLTTSGTIANTGPPPTCSMRIATATGGEITSAEIGESLVLRIDVQPSSIYGGFARRCVAKTMEGDGENEYPVTDEDGCASDPSVFGDWEFEPETQILMAHFNAFKFPSSSSIKFQCNVRVCFGTCPPVNCRGQEAFGRRKRSVVGMEEQNLLAHVGYEGQLREEVQIESNPILAIERREDRLLNPTESPQTLKEEVCISTTGFILSLIVTSVLSLVAVAVAVSCWILAYKRRKRHHGPLPHPPEFPNPLFTGTELITEPLPDYLS